MPAKPETNALLRKAHHALEAAQRDLDATDADNAISRAYYATFYAATAALSQADLTAHTHKGTHHLFYQHYIDPGKIEYQHHRAFLRLFQNRQDVDYAFGVGVMSLEDATHAVQQAEAFVDAVAALLSP